MDSAMYYIAVLAPEAINEQVLKWKHFMRDQFGCIVALKSPAHITLITPFWMNEEKQTELEESLANFSRLQKRILVRIENFDAFKPLVIFVHVLPSEELSNLGYQLEQHLSTDPNFTIKRSTRPLNPHITIANRDLKKADFTTAWQSFSNKKYSGLFEATGLTLMKHNGSQWLAVYTGQFPLK